MNNLTITTTKIPTHISELCFCLEGMCFLRHKDGSKQKVIVYYSPIMEDGDGTVYKEPMAVVRLLDVDIEKPWSIKTQPMRFLEPISHLPHTNSQPLIEKIKE